jgi:hypothetical protein
MSKLSDLSKNLRFNLVGLWAVLCEATYLFFSNVSLGFKAIGRGSVKFIQVNKYTLLDFGLAVAFALSLAFVISMFIFTVSGVAVGWTKFLWIWLGVMPIFCVWFFLENLRK